MSEAPPPVTITEPVTLVVNGQEIEAQKGELLIDACERNGAYIPRFCYHPRMSPVGMCRMCLVEVDSGRGPALQPSCMLECTDGMKVDTATERVQKVQDGVLEFLLINHPLDCPVCDKGGECPLQDQTMAYGPGESRFVEEKRHYTKPIPISETVMLDRERCILCDRCTRFAKEVVDDPLIHFIDRGANTQVNTFPDEPFASYFSGNTVQICPVGALTAKPFRFKARPWDLEAAESTCTTCSVGCRITVESSRDQVLRYQGVDSDPVNWGWLCDKGRFGFEAIDAEARLTGPLVRTGDALHPAAWNDALDQVADALEAAAKGGNGAGGIAVIGGARLTNEAAYAWTKLAKGVLGTDHVDAQLGDGLPADVVLGLPRATIDEAVAPGGVVLYLGPDPKEALPVLYIRLKHAVDHGHVRLVELTSTSSSLTELAAASLAYRPGEAAALADQLVDGGGDLPADVSAARDLISGASSVTVVLGRPSIAESAATIVDAAAVLSRLPNVRFLSGLRRGNVHGALDMGMAPGLLPGRVRRADAGGELSSRWAGVPSADGLDTAGILAAAADGRIDVLVLLGADPIADFPDGRLAERAIAGARTVIAVDTLLNESSRRADVVLAAAGFAEVPGTTTNLEGRVTLLDQRVTAPGTARADWQLAEELSIRLGSDLGFGSVEDVRAEIAEVAPSHAEITTQALADAEAIDGIVPRTSGITFSAPERTTVPAADAYGFRLVVTRVLYDQGTQVQHAEHSKGLARGAELRLNPLDLGTLGVEDGATVSVKVADRSIVVPATADAGVPKGTAAVSLNQADAPVTSLLSHGDVVTDVRIEVIR